MPGVDLALQLIAPAQQFCVAGCQGSHQGRKTAPKSFAVNAGAGYGFVIDEFVQALVDLQMIYGD
jgi:hypothetical protein